MKRAITFNRTTGAVMQVFTSSALVLSDHESDDVGCIEIGFNDLVPDKPYVEFNSAGYKLMGIPDQPTQSHRWDWAEKSWVVDISAAKENRWAAIKAKRDAREFGAFGWCGHEFDGDRDSQRRLNLSLMKAKAAVDAGGDWSVEWTLADNTVITLSAADVISVVEALGDNIDAAHEWARQKRAQIEEATTIDQIIAIS